MLVALLTFAVPCAVVVLLPGPDTLVVVRGLVRGGRRGGVLTAAGVLGGVAVWVAAAALGLSALLRASEIGYDVLKVLGAGYLLWVGFQSLRSSGLRSSGLRSSGRRAAASHDAPGPAVAPARFGSPFLSGFLTDVLNPKVGVTFVTFLPAFVPDGAPVGLTSLALGAEFVVFTAVYFAVLVGLSATVATWMGTPHVRRRLDAVTGLVLVGFGVRLATEA